jgi:hypothetical protein
MNQELKLQQEISNIILIGDLNVLLVTKRINNILKSILNEEDFKMKIKQYLVIKI